MHYYLPPIVIESTLICGWPTVTLMFPLIDPQYPAAKLVKHEYFHGNTVVIVPEEAEGRRTMMGGNLARTSDSRFSRAIEELLEVGTFYGGIPIHDRVEEYR